LAGKCPVPPKRDRRGQGAQYDRDYISGKPRLVPACGRHGPLRYAYFLVIGWLTWKQLRKILEITRSQFRTKAERKFVDDLIVYLDYKIREGKRIRTERKQLSFW
jgi:hypothetical protein